MRVHIGSDHAGLELKAHLVAHLRSAGHELIDHGPASYDDQDDYPPYCLRVGEAVVTDQGSLGIVLGGSGNGEQMAANKVHGVRAALAWDVQTAELGRRHNDANIVSVGVRMHTTAEATGIVDAFLGAEFSGESRHARRIAMLTAYESSGHLPPVAGVD